MRGFSKAIITGNLTRDPEVRSTTSGAQVCSFAVAVNYSYKDSSGTQQDTVSFIDCSAWGKAGEIIAKYAKKGTGILVAGRLNQRNWEDKTSHQKRSKIEIVVEDFNFLGGGDADSSAKSSKASDVDTQVAEEIPEEIPEEINMEEIPF